MPTVKLVVIGASGVGKTSLRTQVCAQKVTDIPSHNRSSTQYVSGRFSTGYRATIGADFIAKTLPHPTKPDEVVTLQIWVNILLSTQHVLRADSRISNVGHCWAGAVFQLIYGVLSWCRRCFAYVRCEPTRDPHRT